MGTSLIRVGNVSPGDSVYIEPHDGSRFSVDKIQMVYGVSLEQEGFGQLLDEVRHIFGLPALEPRIKLRHQDGMRYGYWYPNRGKFALVDGTGTWRQLVNIIDQPCLYVEGGK